MNNKTLLITKHIKKGGKIIPDDKKIPVAIAEEDLDCYDIGEIDETKLYPVTYNNKFYMLPGLKKNILLTRKVMLERKWKEKHKNKE